MRLGAAPALLVLGAAGLLAWHAELFTVARPGARPLPLAPAAPADRRAARFDVTLPAVPVGAARLAPGGRVLLVHFWAPWERHAARQAIALDSLRRALPPGAVDVAVVSFDPFPSLARYLVRLRVHLPVVLDHQGALAGALPCPSMPYTYVLDRDGRIVVAQAGEVDWLAPATWRTLTALLAETPAAPTADGVRL